MKKIILILLLLGLISIVIATNHSPPALNNFQQFYGSVSGISAAGFKVRAQIGTTQFETPIAANGQYGYSPTFKVQGQNGQQINFFIVNAQGAATAVGTAPTPYTNLATTRLDFTYSTAPAGGVDGGQEGGQGDAPFQCGNNIRESSEVCDGTDLAGQTCASQVGTGSTGTLRCPANCLAFNTSQNFDTAQCTPSTSPLLPDVCWQCNEWGQCQNGQETRNCFRDAPCTLTGPDVLTVDPATERTCRNINRTTPTSGTSTCTMSWECGAWSLCRNAQQTRICFRADNCDTLLVQGQITSVTSALKPREEQSCQEGTTTTSQQLCSPGLKRCLGPQLQLCSTDGLEWATLQACTGSCDPISLTCRVEQAAPLPLTQKPSPVWMYWLAGSIVLILIIVSISMALLNKKKYAPAREYIEESRERGTPDTQIKDKLVDEGWDEKGVGKLFK